MSRIACGDAGTAPARADTGTRRTGAAAGERRSYRPRPRRTGIGLALVPSLAAAVSCASPPQESAPPAGGLDLAAYELVDLTHAFNAQTIYWPTSPSRFELDTLSFGDTPGGYFYSAFAFSTPEHGGTHLDAPIHFAEGGEPIDRIPLERLVTPAVVIDITERANGDPDYRLSAADVRAWEAEHGVVPRGAAVLLRTGWSRHWPDRLRYLGDDTPGDASNLRFPSFGEDAARLLVEERGAGVLGADVASIDYGRSTDFIVHRIAAAQNVPGLENLTALDRLPPTGATIIALPVKIEGGSGGPVRVIALLPRS